jgi:hypothetical protein
VIRVTVPQAKCFKIVRCYSSTFQEGVPGTPSFFPGGNLETPVSSFINRRFHHCCIRGDAAAGFDGAAARLCKE